MEGKREGGGMGPSHHATFINSKIHPLRWHSVGIYVHGMTLRCALMAMRSSSP